MLSKRTLDLGEEEITMSEESITKRVDSIDPEVLEKIGVKEVSFAASADTKVNIAQYESMGVFASMGLTFNIDGLTGVMPLQDIINNVVIPLRNSATDLVHTDSMSRTNELRALIQGLRDGKSWAQIAVEVENERKKTQAIMRETFIRK